MTDPTSGCCCETEWKGKRPTKAVPLTDEFIRATAASGSLVPPHDGIGSPWSRVIGAVIAVGVLCLCAGLAVVYGTRV